MQAHIMQVNERGPSRACRVYGTHVVFRLTDSGTIVRLSAVP